MYELPDNMSELVPRDGLLTSSGTEAEDLFNTDAPPTKKEEEEEILKKIMDEYEIEKIRDFFYGGDSDQFNKALEFLRLSPINR